MMDLDLSNRKKFIDKIFYFILLTSPILSVFAGLSVAPIYTILFFIALSQIVTNYKDVKSLLAFSISNKITTYGLHSYVILFIFYAASSVFWSISPKDSINIALLLLFFYISASYIITYIKKRSFSFVQLPLILVIAILCLYAEHVNHGFVTRLLRDIFTDISPNYFFSLPELNRGITYITLLTWPAIALLLTKKHGLIKSAFLLLLAIIIIFDLESLAATSGIIAGIIIFIATFCLSTKIIKYFTISSLVLGITSIPIIIWIFNANYIQEHLPFLPESAMHRVFIWEYCLKQLNILSFIFGNGLNTARVVSSLATETVMGGMHALPLHPHNLAIQLLLEVGLIGLLLYIAIFIKLITICVDCIKNKTTLACVLALIICYQAIGASAYGIWQAWWVASAIIAFIVTYGINNKILATSNNI
jgi:exopolysaccharide production protein ExoQ